MQPNIGNAENKIPKIYTKKLIADGGEFTGRSIYRSVDNDYLVLEGAKTTDAGAKFILYGKQHPTGDGSFAVSATDGGGNLRTLEGKNDGSLTWEGKEIKSMAFPSATSVNITSSTTSVTTYTAPANGYIVCQITQPSEPNWSGVSITTNTNVSASIRAYLYGTNIIHVPVEKGTVATITPEYLESGILVAQFVYAEGEV